MVTSTTATVKIVESPIESVTVEPVSLIEYTNGYFTEDYETGEEYYEYSFASEMNISILWKDGTTTETNGYFVKEYKGKWYGIDITTNQSSDNPWTVGNTYSAEISVLGKNVDVPVSITESPVESITIEPVTLLEYDDGYFDEDYETGEEYFYYELSNKMHATILLKDGTTTETEGSGLYYDDEWYSFDVTTDQSYDNPWTAGNTYSAQVSLMGVSTSVPVTIIEYPIESIELKKLPERTEYSIGEVFSLKGAVIRINYKDGTYEDITVDYSGDAFAMCGYYCYVKRLDDYRTMYIEGYGCATAESGYFTVNFLDDIIEVPITVKERSISSIDAQSKGNQLELTVSYSDGTEQTMKVLDLVVGYADISEEGTVMGGILITDKAIFDAKILVPLDGENIVLRVYNSENTFVSTGNIDSSWWDTLDVIKTLIYSSSYAYGEIETFAGVVTAENIDALAKIVCIAESLLFSEGSVYDEDSDCFIVEANLIEDGFASVFGINPDLTLSDNYNPDNNTYSIVMNSLDAAYKQPIQIEYKDGITVAKAEWTLPKYAMTLTLDDALKLIGLEFTEASDYQLGDVNKDNKINVRDATEIQKHVAKIISLDNEAQMVADYNGDGRISVKDATEIQKKIAGKI